MRISAFGIVIAASLGAVAMLLLLSSVFVQHAPPLTEVMVTSPARHGTGILPARIQEFGIQISACAARPAPQLNQVDYQSLACAPVHAVDSPPELAVAEPNPEAGAAPQSDQHAPDATPNTPAAISTLGQSSEQKDETEAAPTETVDEAVEQAANWTAEAKLDIEAADDSQDRAAALHQLEIAELIRLVGSANEDLVEKIKSELMRREFGPMELKLAGLLADRDPAKKIELIRALPDFRGVNPLPWLFLLASDPDREVRYTALAQLATSGDLAVRQRVEKLCHNDPDQRARQLARMLENDRRAVR